MFRQLTNELICTILRIAIETFVLVDRSTAVNLAQTSKFVYDIAFPILCRCLVVTPNNMERVAVFLNNRNACAHVEVLAVIDEPLFSKRPEVLQRFPKLNTIKAPSMESSVLAHLSDTASLRRVQLGSNSRINLPSSVTHLCLWLGFADMSYLPDWVDSMPALSHLGHEVGLLFQDKVDSQSIAQGLRTLLYDYKCRRLKRVAIRIVGLIIAEFSVQGLVNFIQQNCPDPRIYVWWRRRNMIAPQVLPGPPRMRLLDGISGVNLALGTSYCFQMLPRTTCRN